MSNFEKAAILSVVGCLVFMLGGWFLSHSVGEVFIRCWYFTGGAFGVPFTDWLYERERREGGK